MSFTDEAINCIYVVDNNMFAYSFNDSLYFEVELFWIFSAFWAPTNVFLNSLKCGLSNRFVINTPLSI